MRLRNIPTARQELTDSPYVISESDIFSLRGRWASLFGNNHPIHIEIGMGKGQFLLTLASRYPYVNFIGIERYSSVLVHPVRKLNKAMQAKSVEKSLSDGELAPDRFCAAPSSGQTNTLPVHNLRLLRMDAERLTEIFAPGEVDRIYLNFSDPWPKDRHAKRRLPGRVFLQRYEQILTPGGQVEFKTDNCALFDFAVEEAKEAGWTVIARTYDLHQDPAMNEGNIQTEYEEKFSKLGNPIFKLVESAAQSQ